jgi:anti-sigma factor RsiW
MSEGTLVDACTRAEKAVQGYLDGVLSETERAEIDAHLAECGDCARAYAFEQAFREKFRKCCQGSADEDRCREELRAKLRSCCGEGL